MNHTNGRRPDESVSDQRLRELAQLHYLPAGTQALSYARAAIAADRALQPPAPDGAEDEDDELDSQLEEAWSENEALKEELAEFRKATGCEHAEDVPTRSPHRQHAYGTCTITGPDEDVACIFSRLPDVAEAQPPVQHQEGGNG